MDEILLVLNAGSSSVKFAAYRCAGDGSLAATVRGQVEGLGGHPRLSVEGPDGGTLEARALDAREGGRDPHRLAIEVVLACLERHAGGGRLLGVGHRVVHGGTRYDRPVPIDEAVLRDLARLEPLAPLHQPHCLAGIRAVAATQPALPQVACFDTAFHRTQPRVATRFALPPVLEEAGACRYGFHGLSFESVVARMRTLAPELAAARIVVAHLGNGASMAAVRGGRSVATTMGLTALDGLPMGTRCGALDPGVLLWLLDQRGFDSRSLADLLYRRSGLLGVSGVSSDMRELLASDAPRAAEAIDLFVYRIGRELGSLAAALGGLDALVFTGGIGEHAAPIRARVVADAAWLGLDLDAAANAGGGPRISRAAARPSAWVVASDENGVIARHTLVALGHTGAPGRQASGRAL